MTPSNVKTKYFIMFPIFDILFFSGEEKTEEDEDDDDKEEEVDLQ